MDEKTLNRLVNPSTASSNSKKDGKDCSNGFYLRKRFFEWVKIHKEHDGGGKPNTP
jgi:hypothetical protein